MPGPQALASCVFRYKVRAVSWLDDLLPTLMTLKRLLCQVCERSVSLSYAHLRYESEDCYHQLRYLLGLDTDSVMVRYLSRS